MLLKISSAKWQTFFFNLQNIYSILWCHYIAKWLIFGMNVTDLLHLCCFKFNSSNYFSFCFLTFQNYVEGRLLQITSTIFVPGQGRLFCGREDGSIVCVSAIEAVVLLLMESGKEKGKERLMLVGGWGWGLWWWLRWCWWQWGFAGWRQWWYQCISHDIHRFFSFTKIPTFVNISQNIFLDGYVIVWIAYHWWNGELWRLEIGRYHRSL